MRHPNHPTRAGLRFGSAILLSALVAFEAPAEPPRARPQSPAPRGPAVQLRSANYGLRANDVIEVKVFQEDDLQSTARISRDGTINFPLIGVVRVGGRSAQDAARTIRDLLAKNYLVNPQVSVSVLEYSKRRFTVLGEVQRPGAYDLPDHDAIGLLEAIGMAGGYTRIAEPAKITLKRIVNGRVAVIKLNAKSMAREQGTEPVEVKPGDVLTVGERLF